MSFSRNYSKKAAFFGNKEKNDEKLVHQGKQFLFMSSDNSNRDVYPQLSEPDEYKSATMFSTHSYKFNSKNREQSKLGAKESNTIYFRQVNDRNKMKPRQIPPNTDFPTFRQYISDNKEDFAEECYDESNVRGKTLSISKDNECAIRYCKKSSSKLIENFSFKETKDGGMKNSLQKTQKELVGSRTRYLIGTIDQVIRWYKMVKNAEFELHYEAAGILESKMKKDSMHLMFIRSESGHIIQGVFYTIDRELPDFQPGTTISATGNMIGSNKLLIFDVAEIDKDDFNSIQRLAFLSQRSLQEALEFKLHSLS